MPKQINILFFAGLLGLVLFNNCASPKQGYSSKENLYKKTSNEINTKILAYHIADSTTQLYFTLSNENLLYKRPDTSGSFYAAVKVKYMLYANAKTKQILDSASVTFFDRQNESLIIKNLNGSLYTKCKTGKSYVCDIFVYDLNKKTKTPYVLEIDKTSSKTRQSFLLQKNNGSILYDYNLVAGDTVILKSFMNAENNFVVDYFKREFPMPINPYTNIERQPFDYKPDSFFVTNRVAGICKIIIPEKGFYHLVTEKETKNAHYHVPLVEDAAEAVGAKYKGRYVGTTGLLGVFSFNGNKIITTSGGGMLVSNDQRLIDHAHNLATQARDPGAHYEHSQIGYNYRLSNVLAGIGRGQLRVLEERVMARRRIFESYRSALSPLPGLQFMPEAPWGRSTRWLTCLTIDPALSGGVDRETVRLALEAANIESRPLWKPLHLQPVFQKMGCEVFGRGVSDRLFAQGLCLPSGSAMSEADIERVVEVVSKCWEES